MLTKPSFLYRLILFIFLLCFTSLSLAIELELNDSDRLEFTNSTASNTSLTKPKEGSFADIIDKALEKEFSENEQNEGSFFSSSFLGFTYIDSVA